MDRDSYQPATEAQLPSRKRRPWWRWNLISLAIVLFILLWTRELLQFTPSSAWVMAGSIFFLWAMIPIPWTPSLFSTTSDDSGDPSRGRIVNRKKITTLCRLLAFLLAVASICQAMMIVYQVSTATMLGGVPVLFYMLPMASQFLAPLSQLALAAILWLLAETLEKLDHVMNELRIQTKGQSKENRG